MFALTEIILKIGHSRSLVTVQSFQRYCHLLLENCDFFPSKNLKFDIPNEGNYINFQSPLDVRNKKVWLLKYKIN